MDDFSGTGTQVTSLFYIKQIGIISQVPFEVLFIKRGTRPM